MRAIALVLTYGNSLAVWREAGILERELALYEEHARHGVRSIIVSFGDGRDVEIARRFPFITLVCNRWNLHPRLYAALLPFLYKKILSAAQVVKTNQMYGAHVAYRCAKAAMRPIVIRQGYGYHDFALAHHGADSGEAATAFKYEQKYLRLADGLIFTTEQAAVAAYQRHALDRDRIFVVPNYIVPEAWSPAFVPAASHENFVVAYFGRLVPQKNLESFIAAAAGLPVRLLLLGDGPEKERLRNLAKQRAVACEFRERVPQAELRAVLSDCDVFVLPSHIEGHPKALIEAMAFGMPVIGADSPGIREHIVDGETGLLCAPTPDGIRRALTKALESSELRKKIGSEGRARSLERYSLAAIAKHEREILQTIIERSRV